MKFDNFGDQLKFSEPSWYHGFPTPYYNEQHVAFRAKVRKFVDEELLPHAEKWIEQKAYPMGLHREAYLRGITSVCYPAAVGGIDVPDAFFELIMYDELSRVSGSIFQPHSINSMAIPPIIKYGNEHLKQKVVIPVVQGLKNMALAISEPFAGSDVAGIRTSAVLDPSGQYYLVNGQKKWISAGLTADFFTMLVKVDGKPTVMVVDRAAAGLKVRRMETQFDNASSTTFVTLDDVRVPVDQVVGQVGEGLRIILNNFNHERWLIAVGACRHSRMLFKEAFEWALKRKTFNEPLIAHGVVRAKLSEMARRIEQLHASVEHVCYLMSNGVPDRQLGAECALLKVNAARCLAFCADAASAIFGGSAIVKEGQGKLVERLARTVQATCTPGGAEDILRDLAIRQTVAQYKRSKL